MFYRGSWRAFKTSYAADMALMPLPNTRWAVAALGVLFIVVTPMVANEYNLSVLNLILIAVVGAIGLNILVGYTDQVSIGHGAFMSVGAYYCAAHLITQLHAPFWIAVPAGGLMSAFIGTLVGIPSLRIKGLYLAIATLAAQLIIEWTINHVPWVSGGTQSTIQVGPPSVFGTPIISAWQMYLFLMFFVILAIVGTQNLTFRSRIVAVAFIRDPRSGYRRRKSSASNIFRYKLVGVCDLVVLRRGDRRLVHVLSRHRELRTVPTRRLDQLPGDGDHRRAGVDARSDFRRDFRYALADRDAAGVGISGGAVLRGVGLISCRHTWPAARDSSAG